MTERNTLNVALVGNPNTGKSTLFSALAGVRQRVGNYPGVTVEKKLGRMIVAGKHYQLVDLPGTYSLAPRSPDEMVAVDVLLHRRDDMQRIDAVLSIVDASNLDRNLYLVSQVLEMGLPTVVALNMTDVARAKGIQIDVAKLRERLGVPVIEVQANRRMGVDQLKQALVEAAASGPREERSSPFPEAFREETARLQQAWNAHQKQHLLPRYLAERLLLDTSGYLERALVPNGDGAALDLPSARRRLAAAGCQVPAVEAQSRYGWVAEVLSGIVERPTQRVVTAGDRVDRFLTHKLWGTLVFALLMLVVFSSVFIFADPVMGLIDGWIGSLGELVAGIVPAGPLQSLLVDGVIGGVGSVVIFLPQIVFLFFFLAVLEDCGYMARAAYLMDKLMVRVGLSGKSFIPLLSSFACAIPGVMATRVIENRRDRLTTILVAPLMSCSARLPVYAILIGAFIPATTILGFVPLQGFTLFAMYLLGMVTAAIVALLLKRTLLRGPTPPFVMELPTYKWPSPRIVLLRMAERAWSFLYRAGTLIFAVSVLVWAASYYPRDSQQVETVLKPRQQALSAELAELPEDSPAHQAVAGHLAEVENEIAAAYQRDSYLGRAGRAIEPVVRPLGWDWRIGCAAIASFPAREVVMGVLGVIYNLGGDLDVGAEEDQGRLGARMKAAVWDDSGEPVYNIPVALSIMVFFALCAQCAATLVVIRRETNSWRWPVFTFVYMTTLAYFGALLTYQIGMRLPPL